MTAAQIPADDADILVRDLERRFLAVITPRHRVVRADGGLSGYRWGVVRKAALLSREKLQREAA